MVSSLETATGIAGFRKILKESYFLKIYQSELSFYSTIKSLKKVESVVKFAINDNFIQNSMVKFNPDFKDSNGYFGQVPSGKEFLT